MENADVVIAGGGIGGLALALTLHEIGVSCVVLEQVAELRPLGVGINIQPNAVRELADMGIDTATLDRVGLQALEWALVGRNGAEIYAEKRGLEAGYNWPQYAVHRGEFQMLLFEKVRDRLGADAVRTGCRVLRYDNTADGVTVQIARADGGEESISAKLLVGADGLHSAVRAQMHPDQPAPHWNGAIMWRGTSPGLPVRSGSSFIGLGSARHRMVIYPISPADPETGLATINWIAEVTVDNSEGWQSADWSKQVALEDVLRHFHDWTFDWLDVPALLSGAERIYEYPMIDRDPVPTWVDGSVALMGDAAHVMYPTGSNGASQAIIDARVLGACMIEHGVTPQALSAYDDKLCKKVSELVLRNRGAGPFGILNIVDERCGGVFDNIDDVMPPEERAEFAAGYKAAAGFAIEALNAAPPTIPPGARVRA